MSFRIANIRGNTFHVENQCLATIVVSGVATEYSVPDNIDWHWFSNNGFLDSTSSEDAWEWVKPIESIQIGSSMIGDFTFDDCRTLLNVSLSENVKSIGESAFYKCVNLQTVNGLDSVTSIGWWAFDRCTNLHLDHLPPNLTFLGYGAFANCENFTGDIVIPSGVT